MASTFPKCKLHTSVFETLIINPNIVIAIVFTTSQTQEKTLASPLPPYVFGIKKDHLVINRMYIGLLIESICLEHTCIPAFDHTHTPNNHIVCQRPIILTHEANTVHQ